MNIDFNDPEFKKDIAVYAERFGRDPNEVESELRNQINELPAVFDPDPITNVTIFSNTVSDVLGSKELQEAMPSIVAENYPKRADWTKYDVLRHLIEKGLEIIEAELADEESTDKT